MSQKETKEAKEIARVAGSRLWTTDEQKLCYSPARITHAQGMAHKTIRDLDTIY